MMRSKLMLMTVAVALLTVMNACNGQGYKTTDSGLKYQIHVVNEDQPMPAAGDILSMKMTYGTPDTLFFNSAEMPEQNMMLAMQESTYPGDFYEMMAMLHQGDSATFILAADSFFLKTAGYPKLPDFATDLKELEFNVMLTKIQTEEQVMQEMEAEKNKMRDEEGEKIAAYVQENNLNALPTESGMYVIVTKEGTGSKPVAGDKVKVHYTGMLLDGTKFDSSVDRGTPFEFDLGQGRVIRGWDEGIAMLNVGSKATLIIPSEMGYGERGAGRDIPPFAPLIFEVELLGIVK
ncbi:MAG: FKBP-type peptidyl-prolyl cis-trans isomerase [Clostridia bacterium]|nr:FKBP-type peptidyl-prolyl cis-trans isomerase [Clostridia bacterium]